MSAPINHSPMLFQDAVPSIPVSTAAPPPPPVIQQSTFTNFASPENTIDEPVWDTIKRDVVTIGRNLKSVLIPVQGEFVGREAALRNWDLWGPLIFMLMLAITLSWQEPKPSDVFALVFTEVGLGAVVLTINVILLGGEIVFFQALCLLGYCLFPICVSSIVCAAVTNKIVRSFALLLGLGWAAWATIPFIGSSVPRTRRALAVYPVMLMYMSVGWVALVKS